MRSNKFLITVETIDRYHFNKFKIFLNFGSPKSLKAKQKVLPLASQIRELVAENLLEKLTGEQRR